MVIRYSNYQYVCDVLEDSTIGENNFVPISVWNANMVED